MRLESSGLESWRARELCASGAGERAVRRTSGSGAAGTVGRACVPNAVRSLPVIRSLPTGSGGGSPGGQQRKPARGGSGPWADVF